MGILESERLSPRYYRVCVLFTASFSSGLGLRAGSGTRSSSSFTMGRQPFYDLLLLAYNNLEFVVVAKWNTPYSIARP